MMICFSWRKTRLYASEQVDTLTFHNDPVVVLQSLQLLIKNIKLCCDEYNKSKFSEEQSVKWLLQKFALDVNFRVHFNCPNSHQDGLNYVNNHQMMNYNIHWDISV